MSAAEAKRLLLETVDRAPGLLGKVSSEGVVVSVRAYAAAAVLARVETGQSLEQAIAGLPDALAVDDRGRIGRLVRSVLQARSLRTGGSEDTDGQP